MMCITCNLSRYLREPNILYLQLMENKDVAHKYGIQQDLVAFHPLARGGNTALPNREADVWLVTRKACKTATVASMLYITKCILALRPHIWFHTAESD